jgi:hypothetical protein
MALFDSRRPAALAAGIIFAATVALGAFAGTAQAEDRRDHHDRGEWHQERGHEGHRGWDGGYYRAPPVVYSAPRYYEPPPVVYGPGFGLNINIR